MKKYLDPKETAKRRSKTNLTKGAFGTEGNKIIKKNPLEILERKIPLATQKGKLISTYQQYRVNKSKISKDYSKGK